MLDDGALLGHAALGLLTFATVLLQDLLERVQVHQRGIQVVDLAIQQLLNLTTSVPTTAITKSQELANLNQRQTIRLCLLDELNALSRVDGIDAKASDRTLGAGHQPEALVVSQRVRCKAAAGRQLANPQCGFGRHSRSSGLGEDRELGSHRGLDTLHRCDEIAETARPAWVPDFAGAAACRDVRPKS